MRPLRTLASAVAIVAVLAGAAGCTPDSDATPDPSAFPDACSLLTLDQIEAATGQEFAPGTINPESNGIDSSRCDWYLPEGGGQPVVIVSVSEADFTVAEQREAANDFFGSTADAEVPGGTDAFVTQGGQHVGMGLGPHWVFVTYGEDSTADLTEQTTELARAVAAAYAAGTP